MKIQILHDENGDIHSIGFAAPEFAGEVRLEPEPGQVITVVDTIDLRINENLLASFDKEESRLAFSEALVEIRKNFSSNISKSN